MYCQMTSIYSKLKYALMSFLLKLVCNVFKYIFNHYIFAMIVAIYI